MRSDTLRYDDICATLRITGIHALRASQPQSCGPLRPARGCSARQRATAKALYSNTAVVLALAECTQNQVWHSIYLSITSRDPALASNFFYNQLLQDTRLPSPITRYQDVTCFTNCTSFPRKKSWPCAETLPQNAPPE